MEPIKVLLQGAFSRYSGYGNDLISMSEALVRAGLDVYLQPVLVQPPLPDSICDLLKKELRGPFDIVISHQDPGQLELSEDVKRAVDFSVAWTMWEFTSINGAMPKNIQRGMKSRLKHFDMILGYDSISLEALIPWLYKSRNQVTEILQGGFDPRLWPKAERDWSGPLKMCMLGQLHERKDPFVAIQAIAELNEEHPEFKDNSILSLKTTVHGLHPLISEWCPNIKVYYDVWSQQKTYSFLAQHHMLLAPSRGEGKNLPALEMQCTGGVVAATNWGGHTQWIDSKFAYPIDFKLMPVSEGFPECKNARADKDHLKEIIWSAYTKRDDLKFKGELASKIIPSICSWDNVVSRLINKISVYHPDKTLLDRYNCYA